ncbi:Prophage CP4-57 regulatory protein (AlpA) [compost metagenome]
MHVAPIIKPQAPRPKRGTVNPQPLHAAQIAEALLTIRTVSALTAISPATIYRKVAARAFPLPVRLGNRCTRWRAGDVTAWLSAQVEA